MTSPLITLAATGSDTTTCPGCGTATVALPHFDFADTSVDVPVCDACRDRGLLTVRVKKSALLAG